MDERGELEQQSDHLNSGTYHYDTQSSLDPSGESLLAA